MARLSLILVIAVGLVATASASGDDDNGHNDHGHGNHGHDDHCDSTGEWGEIEVYLKHSRKELRELVRACFAFLVRRDVQPKEAAAWAIRSIEFLLELWNKVLHKHRSFQVDLSSLDTVANEARGSVPWVGPELEETDKYFPGLLQCLPKHAQRSRRQVDSGPIPCTLVYVGNQTASDVGTGLILDGFECLVD